jgi:hypothetical protein
VTVQQRTSIRAGERHRDCGTGWEICHGLQQTIGPQQTEIALKGTAPGRRVPRNALCRHFPQN